VKFTFLGYALWSSTPKLRTFYPKKKSAGENYQAANMCRNSQAGGLAVLIQLVISDRISIVIPRCSVGIDGVGSFTLTIIPIPEASPKKKKKDTVSCGLVLLNTW